MSSIAEQRAADVYSGRQKLDTGRETLDRYRANELAEAEALSLARIKADTERALSHQAQALRDAERAAELVAIERRAIDLDATKEAQRRLALEREAHHAISARSTADTLAATIAMEKQAALASVHDAQQTRLAAQRDALVAQRNLRSARIGLAWIAVRSASPIVVGVVAVMLGIGIGWLAAKWQGNPATVTATYEEAPLRIDTELLRRPLLH